MPVLLPCVQGPSIKLVNLTAIPKLTDLIAEPDKVSDVPIEGIAKLRGQLSELDTILLSRLLGAGGNGSVGRQEGDRLLTAKEAGEMLSRSEDAMYRQADQLPFTVRDGRRVRFSEKGIEKHIRQRMGK